MAAVLPHLLPDFAATRDRQGVEAETRHFLISLIDLAPFCGVERRVRVVATLARGWT